MRYKGRHRATKDSLTVADIREALHAEAAWTDVLYHGPVTIPDIDCYLLRGAA